MYDLSGKTGSLLYMAPEVYRKNVYNESSDVFSFGIILYEVFAREHPYISYARDTLNVSVRKYINAILDGYLIIIINLKKLMVKCIVIDQNYASIGLKNLKNVY